MFSEMCKGVHVAPWKKHCVIHDVIQFPRGLGPSASHLSSFYDIYVEAFFHEWSWTLRLGSGSLELPIQYFWLASDLNGQAHIFCILERYVRFVKKPNEDILTTWKTIRAKVQQNFA